MGIVSYHIHWHCSNDSIYVLVSKFYYSTKYLKASYKKRLIELLIFKTQKNHIYICIYIYLFIYLYIFIYIKYITTNPSGDQCRDIDCGDSGICINLLNSYKCLCYDDSKWNSSSLTCFIPASIYDHSSACLGHCLHGGTCILNPLSRPKCL